MFTPTSRRALIALGLATATTVATVAPPASAIPYDWYNPVKDFIMNEAEGEAEYQLFMNGDLGAAGELSHEMSSELTDEEIAGIVIAVLAILGLAGGGIAISQGLIPGVTLPF